MNGVGTRFTGRRDQTRDGEIALGRRGRADGDGPIRRAHVGAAAVGRGIDRDGLEALCVTRPDDTESDLAAVGDENTFHVAERTEKTEKT